MIHEDGDNDTNGEFGVNVEEEDGEWIRFLGGNSSSGIKKYRGSNSNDGGNTGDGVKITGGVIGSGDEIGLRFLNFFYDPRIIWEQRIAALWLHDEVLRSRSSRIASGRCIKRWKFLEEFLGPYAYIMAAYGVPPSPDYIPGPEGPPSPDYVPGPEEPEQAPPSPVYLPYPLHTATSPTAESPGYIPESDPEEDPEEDPADYPADRDDDDNEEEEEEYPALADSVPPVHGMTARISIRDEPSISLPPREEVERLLTLTTPPQSHLLPLSSPFPQFTFTNTQSPYHIEDLRVFYLFRRGLHFGLLTP
ncbi:hypothetical protein Tco_1562643 [Tanacetum coccineum]